MLAAKGNDVPSSFGNHYERVAVVRTVMKVNATIAPAYTTNLGCCIDMIAAMIKVSSPSSVAKICGDTQFRLVLYHDIELLFAV